MRGRAQDRKRMGLPERNTLAEENEARMTFTEHLGELRTRIIRSMIAIVVGFCITAWFSEEVLYLIAQPLLLETPSVQGPDSGSTETAGAPSKPAPEWTTLGPLEGFFVRFKVAMYAALVLALPYILYQICAFIFPGLKSNERQLAKFLIMGCSVLAILGVLVAYLGVFPLVLPYLLEYNPDWVTTQLRMQETIALLLVGLVGFAVAFQFPMVLLILVYLGLLSVETLRKYRRLAIVGLACASAVLTPSPDPFSMMIMLIPLLILYEVSILLSTIVTRRRLAKNGAGDRT